MAREETRDLGLAGCAFALGAFTLWGVLPAYWKALGNVAPPEILAHRVVWSLLFTLAIAAAMGRLPELRAALATRRNRLALFASGILIAANWGMFIWSVSVGRLVEASFGYYINPLVNVALGVLLLGERLSGLQRIAIGVAALGVLALGVGTGATPWLPLALAATFGLYGLVRKLTPVSSLAGFSVETSMLAPLALGYLLVLGDSGAGQLAVTDLRTSVLLIFSGVVTALPLIWFASAAKRLSFSTLGILQYLSPTLSFLLAVGVYGEPFSEFHAFAFACVWVAVGLYSVDLLRGGAAAPVEVADAGP
ncbi:MAG: EamA family transporter RarD [Myxococcota bacterium]